MSSSQSVSPPSESSQNIVIFESHRASEDANPDPNLELSLSCPTDETSIYNAARTNSGIEGNTRHSELGSTVKNSLDAREAANMAMFLSRTSEPASRLTQRGSDPGGAAQKSKSPWWQSLFWSDNHAPCATDSGKDEEVSLPDESSRTTSALSSRRRCRKAASFDVTMSTATRLSKWPGNVGSPVGPAQPNYPPPVRPATPPGLPSFGTPEAMCYATQYAVRSATTHRQTQRGNQPSTNRCRGRAASYGEWVRRLFGSSGAAQARPNLQSCQVVRAEDGTIVQGRFPYRNSGHGTHMGGRGLESHPFHRGTLSVAECSLVNSTVAQGASLSQGKHNARQRGGILLDWRNQYPNREPGVDSPAPKGALAALLRHVAASTGPASQPSARTTCPPLSRYHSCTSQPITVQPRVSGAALGYTPDPSTGCTSRTTRSPPDQQSPQTDNQHEDTTTIWHQSKQLVNAYLCCPCSCGSASEQDTLLYPSNETYMTAHGWISNVSSGENARANLEYPGRANQTGGRWWWTGVWRSFRGFAARNGNVLGVDCVLA